MKNKEMNENVPVELDEKTLETVSGGQMTDSESKDDIPGGLLPAMLNPFQ